MVRRKNMSDNHQEISEEILEMLEKMKHEIIEEMVRTGWDRKKAEAQAETFS